jgi:hypothetical protein
LECLLQSDSEQSLSDSDSDIENELEVRALLDTVENDGSKEDDDSTTQDFVWQNMENYRGQRENFMGSVGAQGAAKHVTDIEDVFELFFNKEQTDMQSSSYVGVNYQSGRLLGHGNL